MRDVHLTDGEAPLSRQSGIVSLLDVFMLALSLLFIWSHHLSSHFRRSNQLSTPPRTMLNLETNLEARRSRYKVIENGSTVNHFILW